MPNIANILKSEIARVARKEVRAETKGLKSAIAPYRSQIAELKRRIRELELKVNRLGRVTARAASAAPDEEGGERSLRFSAKGLATQRKRLGLSAQARAATEVFNQAVGRYNDAIAQFPALLLASLFGFKPGRRV